MLCWILARGNKVGARFVADRLRASPELLEEVIGRLGGNLERYLPPQDYLCPDRIYSLISDCDLITILLSEIKARANLHDQYDFEENPFRAAGRLDSPLSVDWLRSVAGLTDVWSERDDHGRLDASTCAKAVLAELGAPEYVSASVDHELEEQLNRWPWIFTGRLDRRPRQIVRERILRRMKAGSSKPHLVWLLSRYSDSRDRNLLLSLESSEDSEVADIAHQRLRWSGFMGTVSHG